MLYCRYSGSICIYAQVAYVILSGSICIYNIKRVNQNGSISHKNISVNIKIWKEKFYFVKLVQPPIKIQVTCVWSLILT